LSGGGWGGGRGFGELLRVCGGEGEWSRGWRLGAVPWRVGHPAAPLVGRRVEKARCDGVGGVRDDGPAGVGSWVG